MITQIQRDEGTLSDNKTFFQQASKEFIGKDITFNQSLWVDTLLIWLILGIAVVTTTVRIM